MDALYKEFLQALMDTYGAPGANAGTTRICNSRR
jgi:hypothetical protein